MQVLDRQATRAAFAKLGADVVKTTPDETRQRFKSDIDKWTKLRQQTHITISD
jgi:DhnA family fructose-bisphosphate aldolase class Ia